ncbi:MAG: sigma 54-interacting transcriptional regulator [Planctomycetes bacterium]|nr:sigma 54-interacting transcriptional regulator [Planctomycetota bacterium]
MATRADGTIVLRAKGPAGEDVVLRLAPAVQAGTLLAELAVLETVVHPGIAKAHGYGLLEDGVVWSAREWIDGVELGRWAVGKSPAELGRAVAELCFALAHLHARGFVHGDLKAQNVLVRADGRAVLTDFGLATLAGVEHRGVSGSWLALAPECLAGRAPEPASDLFALGVLIAGLLSEIRVTPRAFYARFPMQEFFAAAEISAGVLPEWARDLVTRLVARDPAERPPSATWVARALAARLGFEVEAPDEGDAPRVSVWLGREEVGRVAATAASHVWLECAAAEDVERIAHDLALGAMLSGARVERLDLERELARVHDSVELDAWARERARRGADQVFVAAIARDGARELRALECLVRAARQVAGHSRIIAVIARGNPLPGADIGGLRLLLFAATEETWREFANDRFAEESEERRRTFAAWLARASAGSVVLAERALERAARAGAVRAAGDAYRVFVALLPKTGEETAGRPPEGVAARRVLAAFHVLGERAPLVEIGPLAGLAGVRELERAVEELVAGDFLRRRGAELERSCDPLPALETLLAKDELREFGQRVAAHLRGLDVRDERLALFEWVGGRRSFAEFVEELHALRERGWHEVALRLATEARAFTREACERETLTHERGACWLGLGDIERAQALADELDEAADRVSGAADASSASAPSRAPEEEGATKSSGAAARSDTAKSSNTAGRERGVAARGFAQRLRAAIALQRHDPRTALAAAAHAREAAPELAFAAGVLEARALYELRRDAEVIDRCETLLAQAPRAAERAALVQVQALALARQGELERAAQRLGEEQSLAERAGDRQRAAALALDLATLARRRGLVDEARAAYERALAGHQAAGFLPGVAQVRAQWGAFLRERGELAASEPLLASALELRERLGDRAGAIAVRGMLGLGFAERGHVRAALDELGRASDELAKQRKTVEAMFLAARADECAARIGRQSSGERAAPGAPGATRAPGAPGALVPSAGPGAAGLAEGDPRTLLGLGRARWLAGDEPGARDAFERAERLARSVGLRAVLEEASALAARLAGRPLAPATTAEFANELVREDEELLQWLAAPDLERPEVLARLDALEARGRDDRAARLACALAARTADARRAAKYHERHAASLARCSVGLTDAEARELRRTLFAIPDPFPEDLTAGERRSAGDEEFEMEVVSLLEINRQLLAQEDLARLLGTIVEKALEVSGAQRGFLILEEDGELAFDTARDSRRGDIRDPELEVSRSVLAQALECMQPIRVSNAAEEPDYAAAPSVIALDLRSILCVPFRVDPKLRGVIYVDHRLMESAFSPRAERMLALLADQAGLAILQVRRLEEIRRLNRELRGQVANREAELSSARRALANAGVATPREGLVGSSGPMRAAQRMLERAAQVKLPVLVTGESGTGKELAARALHSLSPRASAPFVSENCAALPPSLIEAELFGARRGAFTGADRDRDGLIERAHGGTLFLDEIGELPLELQAKLLRVLETGEVRRLGESTSRAVDFRLVAATNRDLEKEVRENRFRSDLYYRLDGLRVRMPSLSERESDIPELVEHFMRLQAAETGVVRKIAPIVVARLARRAWPGNVRELFNELARLAVLSEGDIVDPELVRDPGLFKSEAPRAVGASVKSLAELEREAIFHALEVAGNDKRKAAELLGISRAKIYQRLKDWGITGGPNGDSEP